MGDRAALVPAWAALGAVGLDRLARALPRGWATWPRSEPAVFAHPYTSSVHESPAAVQAELAQLRADVERLGRDLEATRRPEFEEFVLPFSHAVIGLVGASSWTPWVIRLVAWCVGRPVVYRRPQQTRF